MNRDELDDQIAEAIPSSDAVKNLREFDREIYRRNIPEAFYITTDWEGGFDVCGRAEYIDGAGYLMKCGFLINISGNGMSWFCETASNDEIITEYSGELDIIAIDGALESYIRRVDEIQQYDHKPYKREPSRHARMMFVAIAQIIGVFGISSNIDAAMLRGHLMDLIPDGEWWNWLPENYWEDGITAKLGEQEKEVRQKQGGSDET